MLILGLLLIAVAALAAVGAVFVLDGEATYFGVETDAFTVFLVGAASVAVFVAGLKLTGFGARREIRARREHKQLSRLSQKLESVDQDRRDEQA